MKNEYGVAMATVIFIAAILSLVTSTASFVAIRELRASTDDRASSAALAAAEGGVDRMVELLRGGDLTWGEIRVAGCDLEHPPVTVVGEPGVGVAGFETTFQVDPIEECTQRAATPDLDDGPFSFSITSSGEHPAAVQVVRQEIAIGTSDLPVGIVSDGASASGSPQMEGVSLITQGDVVGREKMSFSGTDAAHSVEDFWPGSGSQEPAPAAVHATGTIYIRSAGGACARCRPDVEHPPGQALNCTANDGPGATAGQSQWDESGGGAPIGSGESCSNWAGIPTGPPPDSRFTAEDFERVVSEDALSDQAHLALKDSAQRTGLYCSFSADEGSACTRAGEPWTLSGGRTVAQTDVDAIVAPPNGNTSFVAYFEFAPGTSPDANLIHWKATDLACSTGRSVVLVVRNGSFQTEGGAGELSGAFFVPEGIFRTAGNTTINGTVIAKAFDNRGNATFRLDDCWTANAPAPLMTVELGVWELVGL